MPSSKNASPPAIASSLRQSSARLEPLRDRREVREHHLADRALGEQPPQRHGQRLVVVVLADEDDAAGAVARLAHRQVVRHARGTPASRRARACRPRAPQRQVEVEARRHGDDDRVDARVGDGRRVVAVGRAAAELPAVRLGLRARRGWRSWRDLGPSARRCRLCTRVMKPHPRKAMMDGTRHQGGPPR